MAWNGSEKAVRRQVARRVAAPGLDGLPVLVPGVAQLPDVLPRPPVGLDLPVGPVAPARDYVRPGYAGRFQCIAARCEDNCCKGWGVPIDQATYEKYRSTPGLKQHLGTLVVLNTNQPTAADYARIPLTAQAECGFLDGEKMCGIQKEYGHEMLSATCATYPRAVSTNVGQVEKALNLSCPEAARVTLLDARLLGDGAWQVAGPERYAMVTRRRPVAAWEMPVLDGAAQMSRRRGQFEPRLAVREFALLLLGDRRYPLWQRLYLLGNLARRLQALSVSSGKRSAGAWCEAFPGRVQKLLHEYVRTAATESMRPLMDEIRMQPDQQIQLVLEMLRSRFAEPPVPMRFLECVREFQLGLGTATAANEEEILAAYAESYRRYYKPLMERHPQLLENYLTNMVFKSNYPLGRVEASGRAPATAWNSENEHLMLCMHAAVAQTLLIGMAGHYKDAFDATHVVKLVQSLAKTLEHSRRAMEQMAEFVQARKLNNPQGIALLLRTQD